MRACCLLLLLTGASGLVARPLFLGRRVAPYAAKTVPEPAAANIGAALSAEIGKMKIEIAALTALQRTSATTRIVGGGLAIGGASQGA